MDHFPQKNEKICGSTWGCAYVAPNEPDAVYREILFKIIREAFEFYAMIEKKGYDEIKKDEIFPESRKYRSFYLDFFENPRLLIR